MAEVPDGGALGITSTDPRVSSWLLSGTETPSQMVAEVTRRVGPYFWEVYESGHPHQLRRFLPRRFLSDYAMEIASLEWQLCYLAVANFTSTLDPITRNRASIPWDRTLWKNTDFLELEDVEMFAARLIRVFGKGNDPTPDALFFEKWAIELQGALEELLKAVHLPKDFALPTIQADQRRPLLDYFLSLRVTDRRGGLIDKGRDEAQWLKARKLGITATDANRLIKLSGERRTSWWDVLESKSPDFIPFEFDSYALGVEREPIIAEWTIESFPDEDFITNPWLFADSEEPRFMATPDLIGQYAIAEIKVSSKPLGQILSRYRDQVQWQLKVLDCERLLFVVEQRATQTIEAKWIYADPKRQYQLETAAYEMLAELEEELPDVFT